MKPDIEQLEGRWDVVSLEMDGRTFPAAALGGAAIEVRGQTFKSTGMGAEYGGTIRLDPASTPKACDMTFTTGPEKGNTNAGIYELDGDRWRICLNTRGEVRPEEFASAAGIALEVLERCVGPS